LAELSPGDGLLTQNETNAVAETLRAARAAGLKTCLNPAPITPAVAGYPLDCVDSLVVNETEGRDLSGATTPNEILDALLSRWPALAIVVTLGAEGATNHIDPAMKQMTALPATGRAAAETMQRAVVHSLPK